MILISYLLHDVIKGIQLEYEQRIGKNTPEDYENIRIQHELMKTGLEIIPDTLWIRNYTLMDIERFRSHFDDTDFLPPIPTEKQLLIEYRYADTWGWDWGSPNDWVILALQLLRKGKFVVDYHYTIEEDTDIITLIPLYMFNTSPLVVPINYSLFPSDVFRIKTLFEKLMKYEWVIDDPFRISIYWFQKACNEKNYESKILDLCKGYEALFTQGQKVKGPIREYLARKCGHLLSRIFEYETVYDTINYSYTIRNDLMHGRLPKNYTRITIEYFEEYLRTALRIILLRTKTEGIHQ